MGLDADKLAGFEADRSGANGHEADDRVAERRLSHAIAANNREHAALESERDALERVRLAIIDLQVLNLQNRLRLLRRYGADLIHAPLRDRSPEPLRRPRSRLARLP